MKTDVGEYIVGAYLKLIRGCDFVDYNVRPPGGGMKGLGELDVVGLDLRNSIAYLCEVTTHIWGLRYGSSNETTVQRVREKHARQREYAAEHLREFNTLHFMFWSPVVPVGPITRGLETIDTLGSVINERYARRVDDLRELARKTTHDTGNPFFRMLQILEHLRE